MRKAVLVVGSPRMMKSTSYSLGYYLIECLKGMSFTCFTIYSLKAAADPDIMEHAVECLKNCQLIISSFPLYADSLPSSLVKLYETISKQSKDFFPEKQKGMLAICNSAFPEPAQCSTALEICRCFAERSGMKWRGGISVGAGELINGRPLSELGGIAKKNYQSP